MKKLATISVLLLLPFIVNAKTIKICGASWPPSTIVESNKIVKGYSIEVYKEAFKRLSIEFEIKVLPWKRCTSSVSAGEFDAIIDTSTANKSFIIGKNPNSFSPLAIYVRKDFPEERYSQEKMKGKLVGIVRGYSSYLKVAKENGWEVKETNDEENMFTMLGGKRFDYAFSDTTTTAEISKKVGVPVKYLRPTVFTDSYYLGFSPNNKDLARQYDITITEMVKEGIMDKIYKKYLPINYSEMLIQSRK